MDRAPAALLPSQAWVTRRLATVASSRHLRCDGDGPFRAMMRRSATLRRWLECLLPPCSSRDDLHQRCRRAGRECRPVLFALLQCRDSRHRWANGPAACAVRLPLPRCRLSRNHVGQGQPPTGQANCDTGITEHGECREKSPIQPAGAAASSSSRSPGGWTGQNMPNQLEVPAMDRARSAAWPRTGPVLTGPKLR